jgi:hypothetical protein
MKGDSAGIEINDVPKKGFAGKADPVHPVAPCKGDVRFGGDDDGSAGSFANERGRPEDGTAGARGMKPMTKKVAVTASVFVFFLAVCIGISIRSSNKTKPTATSSALALEGTDSVFPEVINGETLDFNVWQQSRRYLVDIRRNGDGGHFCGATLISRRVVLTAAREFEKFK